VSSSPIPQRVELSATIEALYRQESGRILATLIRLLGDFDVAEDAMHDAFSAALEHWALHGVPANPRAWLISTGRFKAIDAFRRRTKLDASQEGIADALHADVDTSTGTDELQDDRLKLIFTCCHPAVPADAHAALTLREICGLTTEEIARAFLATPPAIAQRIVRAKARIREARIPFVVPAGPELPGRLAPVLAVIYLLYNEGYLASGGPTLIRSELSSEAIRLARVLLELLPEPEVSGLLALMLLHESRAQARTGPDGEMVLLEQQDRSRWNQTLIREGIQLVERALSTRRFGPYTLQAAIAAVHAEAPTAEATDWRQISALYAALSAMQPSPVVELNRAVAIAMHQGPEAGLAIIDALLEGGELRKYYLAHSARADLLRRLGRKSEAGSAYRVALELVSSETERRFLQKRFDELSEK
jgi:RNA polymerase sigma-70 factor, ECF subfamily